MNTSEDQLITSAMRAIGRTHEAPADAVQQIVTRVNRRRSIGQVVSTAAAVAIVALGLAAAAEVVQVNEAGEPVLATSTATPAPTNWQQLTGKELGEALGWTAVPTGSDNPDCDHVAAEYVDGMVFCFTVADLEAVGLPTTEIDQLVLAYQITGVERSPELFEYVRLQEETEEIMTPPWSEESWDRHDQIRDRMRVLRSQLWR